MNTYIYENTNSGYTNLGYCYFDVVGNCKYFHNLLNTMKIMFFLKYNCL